MNWRRGVLLVLLCYVLSYVVLSSFGRWQRVATGRLGVWRDTAIWQPAGMYVKRWHGGEWSARGLASYVYFPLVVLDRKWVHQDKDVVYVDDAGNVVDFPPRPGRGEGYD